MKNILLVIMLVSIAMLSAYVYELRDRTDFLHAWNVVKKIRVDRLEKKICEELRRSSHE